MKRILILVMVSIICLCAMATPPNLRSEKVFDEVRKGNSKISCMITKRNGRYVRTLTFTNLPNVLKKIQNAFEVDKEKAVGYSHMYDEGDLMESIEIVNNGHTIQIGFQCEDKDVYFFIMGPEDAFK